MKVVVGLGNPGKRYFYTRHNIGVRVIRKIAEDAQVKFKKGGLFSRIKKAGVCFGKKDVVLVEPLTYMNLSGLAVKECVKKFRISLENLLVICDDINLPFGALRIRSKGSSGGHNGLKSIIENLNSENFARLRIGIGKPARGAAEYVLSFFSPEEEIVVKKDLIPKSAQTVKIWATDGIDKTMAAVN